MSFDWSEYLSLAEDLIGLPHAEPVSDEAKWRVSTSRAYYAAYWTARNHLAKDPHFAIPPGKPVHAYVIERYVMSNDPALQDIGADLETLRIERVTADYKAEDSVTSGDATSTAILAAKLIQAIEIL